MKLLIFNLLVSGLADAFIFGEWYKSRPYRFLFPRKPFVFITYYPDKKYISFLKHELSADKLRLSYSGRISLEKGFGNFINVLKELSGSEKDYKIEVKIIGWYENVKDRNECGDLIKSLDPDITLSFYEKQNLFEFIELIRDTDIFIDLRVNDFENSHCLPIRLFYYAALGKPVIFTNLKSVKKEVEISKFGFLVNPDDKNKIAEIISTYLRNQEFYYTHCAGARNLFETKYNWGKIEPWLLDFLNEISSC